MKRGGDEPVSERDQGAAPQVPLPSAGAPVAVLIGLLVLAIGLFLFLEGRRKPEPREVASTAPIAPAPRLRLPIAPQAPPPPPPPPPAPEIRYVTQPAPPPEIRYVERPAPPGPERSVSMGRLSEPALVVDLVENGPVESPVRAAKLRSRSATVPQGATIPAVLETPINSARMGPVRAVVSEDIRGFDGTRVLIPKGSRIIGEVREGAAGGRAVINWSRLVRPDGVSISINAPATDAVGSAGAAGVVDNHTLARISGIALQTAFQIGATLASQPRNGAVVVSNPGQAIGNIGQVLSPQGEFKPSVRVKKGAAITVFVMRDLDFGGMSVP